jgi:hypothetical protein
MTGNLSTSTPTTRQPPLPRRPSLQTFSVEIIRLTLIGTRSCRSLNAGRQAGDQREYGAGEPHVGLLQSRQQRPVAAHVHRDHERKQRNGGSTWETGSGITGGGILGSGIATAHCVMVEYTVSGDAKPRPIFSRDINSFRDYIRDIIMLFQELYCKVLLGNRTDRKLGSLWI